MQAMDIDHYLVSAARRAHRLRRDRDYLIGREQGADIHLQDALISRKHAILSWSDGEGWVLHDQGSRNGSMINAARVNGQQLLSDQDRLQFGGHVYQYHMVPPGSDLNLISNSGPQIDNDVTMGPGVNMADLATAGAAFSGKLSEGGVLDMLQFLMLTRKTGRLDLLKGPAQIGSVHVQEGGVAEATTAIGNGFDALLGLAKADLDNFAFHTECEPPPAVTISMSTEAVLMELARQLDEG